MLVLSRKSGEELVIGEARIEILSVGPRSVRLAIRAPRNVLILRGELIDRANPRSDDDGTCCDRV